MVGLFLAPAKVIRFDARLGQLWSRRNPTEAMVPFLEDDDLGDTMAADSGVIVVSDPLNSDSSEPVFHGVSAEVLQSAEEKIKAWNSLFLGDVDVIENGERNLTDRTHPSVKAANMSVICPVDGCGRELKNAGRCKEHLRRCHPGWIEFQRKEGGLHVQCSVCGNFVERGPIYDEHVSYHALGPLLSVLQAETEIAENDNTKTALSLYNMLRAMRGWFAKAVNMEIAQEDPLEAYFREDCAMPEDVAIRKMYAHFQSQVFKPFIESSAERGDPGRVNVGRPPRHNLMIPSLRAAENVTFLDEVGYAFPESPKAKVRATSMTALKITTAAMDIVLFKKLGAELDASNIYYRHRKTPFSDRQDASMTVTRLCLWLSVRQAELNVVSASKCMLTGPVDLIYRSRTVRCDEFKGPHEAKDLIGINTSRVKYMLIVEDLGTFRRFVGEGFDGIKDGALLTGRGFPCRSTQTIVSEFRRKAVPVYVLVDCDIAGFRIYLAYHYGSPRAAFCGYVTPPVPIEWIGLKPSRLMPERESRQAPEEDLATLKELLKKQYVPISMKQEIATAITEGKFADSSTLNLRDVLVDIPNSSLPEPIISPKRVMTKDQEEQYAETLLQFAEKRRRLDEEEHNFRSQASFMLSQAEE